MSNSFLILSSTINISMGIKGRQRKQQLLTLVQKFNLPDISTLNWSLLDLALTHPSFSPTENFQQLEFLGDSVVRLVAAQVLLETYPEALVGDFAALRSVMVSDRTLAEFADLYQLESYLLIAPQAITDQGGRISRLADAFEAVLGALYLSIQNMDLIRPWLDPLLQQKAAEILQDPARQNYKDALQEWTQANHKLLPQYRVQEINPRTSEDERFLAEVWLQDQKLGAGTGRTKKAAQQAAAKAVFQAWIGSKI